MSTLMVWGRDEESVSSGYSSRSMSVGMGITAGGAVPASGDCDVGTDRPVAAPTSSIPASPPRWMYDSGVRRANGEARFHGGRWGSRDGSAGVRELKRRELWRDGVGGVPARDVAGGYAE